MKLPANTIILRRKASEYLLQKRRDDDKSGFLALAGYTAQDADRLIRDIREQLFPLEAEFHGQTKYGLKYRIRGTLTGPNGRALRVLSIWMKENATGDTKFVTLLPDRL